MKRAIFLDRDKTLNPDPAPGYLNDPAQLRLLPGVVEAVRAINRAGYLAIVISNQGGVGLGRITPENLDAIDERLRQLLAAGGAQLDAIYYCPYHPDGDGCFTDSAHLRKPEPGMLLQAAERFGIDLGRSWMVGDALRDVQAGHRAGCRNVLLGAKPATPLPKNTFTAADLSAAVTLILQMDDAVEKQDPTTAPAEPTAPAPTDNIERQLGEIHREIRKFSRDQQRQDFSYAKIFAGLAQAMVFFCLLLAYFAHSDPAEATANAVEVRLLLGAVFQMMALTFYIMNTR